MSGSNKSLARITQGGNLIGGIFIIAGMLLLMSNILGRFIHFVIPGSYEMFELCMALGVAVALVHAGMQNAHVVVNLLTSRFPPLLKAVSKVVVFILSFATWAFTAYAAAYIAYENGFEEITETLKIPYLPFRIVWTICLFLFSIIYFGRFYQALRRLRNK